MRSLKLCLSYLVTLPVFLSFASQVSSQPAVPLLINYQGELRSPTTGEPVPDGSYDMVFRVYDVQFAGTALWQGTHSEMNGNPVEVTNGIFSVILGSGTGNVLDASVFDGADRWLGIQVRTEGLSPRQRITSVAYSLVSKNSRLLGGKESSEYVIQSQGLRLETNAASPNIIGGYVGNAVTTGAAGATISGGGFSDGANSVTDAFGAIGGGTGNQAGDNAWSVDNAMYATVSGGESNTASGAGATVAGGGRNTASGYLATIGGGSHNEALATYATIAGGGPSDLNNPTTRNRVTDNYGAIGGGGNNQAGDSAGTTTDAWYATVGGGVDNTAGAAYATVGGGDDNTASGPCATVGGGRYNLANASYATIAGGGPSDPANPSATKNLVTDDYGTIGGGGNNQAGDNAGTTVDRPYATVAGGASNTASGHHATVGGGDTNTASGANATVAGGSLSTASGQFSAVGGGTNNQAGARGSAVGGGELNIASGDWATVAGGGTNKAIGPNAMVPGGAFNDAEGRLSFAAGYRAKAKHAGALVWADSQEADMTSSANDQVTFRCQGGVRFLSSAAGANQTVSWAPGNASWTFASDRSLKENFVEIDPREVLERVSHLPISEWNFKGYTLRHIGPVAQDFQALFPLGGNETMIDSGDLHGVALAAIQGLHNMLSEKDAKIATLEARISALEGLVTKLVESQAGGEE